MLILLASIFALILILGIVFTCAVSHYRDCYRKDGTDKWYAFGHFLCKFDIEEICCYIGGIGLALMLLAMLCIGIKVSNEMVIDDKIAMYEEENAAINQEINILVSNYQKHEADVFDNAAENISPTVVLSLYPELKSNTLVEKQIDTYVANQKEIKSLKASKLDYEVYKWWLHF